MDPVCVRRQVRGFTFIELLFVIALVAVLAGLVTVSFSQGFKARQVENEVRNINEFIRYMQYRAIELGETQRMESKDFLAQVKNQNLEIKLERGKDVYFFPDGNVTRNRIWIGKGTRRFAAVDILNRLGSTQVTYDKVKIS